MAGWSTGWSLAGGPQVWPTETAWPKAPVRLQGAPNVGIAGISGPVYSASGINSIVPTYPTGVAANHLLVLVVGHKSLLGPEGAGTVVTPAGWQLVGAHFASVYDATPAADVGNTSVHVFVRRADGTETGTFTVTMTGSTVAWAQIVSFANQTGGWAVAEAGTTDETGGNVSATFTDLGLTGGDYVLAGMVTPTDVNVGAEFTDEALSAPGVVFESVTEQAEPQSSAGNDIGGFLVSAPVTSGPSSGGATLTATAGGTGTNIMGPLFLLRVRQVVAGSFTAPTTFLGNGTLTTTGVPGYLGVGALSGDGTLIASGTAAFPVVGTATLTGDGSLTAAGAPAIPVPVSLSGAGTLSASAAPAPTQVAALSGSGTLAAVGTPSPAQTVALSGSGSLTASTTPRPTQAAALSGTGSLSTTSTLAASGAAALSGAGSLTLTTIPRPATVVALSGSGSLAAAGAPGFPGTAALSGSGSLAASGASSGSVPVALSGAGSLTTGAAPAPAQTAALSGSGALALTTAPAAPGAVVLSGDGSLAAGGGPGFADVGALSGSGALSTSAALTANDAVALSGSGTLGAIGVLATPVTYVTSSAISYSASGTNSIAVTYPAGITAGQEMVVFVGHKPTTNTATGANITTPSGWTALVTGTTGTYGSTGADIGNTSLTVLYRTALGTESGSLIVGLNNSGVAWAQMVVLGNGTGGWALAGIAVSDPTAGSVSATYASDVGLTAGDMIVSGMSIPTNVGAGSQFSAETYAATGVTMGTATEISEPNSANGTHIGGFLFYQPVASGTSTAAGTMTATAAGTTTNVRGPTVLVRARQVVPAFSATAPLSGSGSLATASAPAPGGGATLSGSGSLATTAAPAPGAATALSGAGTLSTTGAPAEAVSVALSGSGALSASGVATGLGQGTATLTGSGALTTAGTPRPAASAALSGAGTLSAAPTTQAGGAAVLGGSGALLAGGAPRPGQALGFSGVGTLAATGTASTSASGSAVFSGVGVLSSTGSPKPSGVATLSGSGVLSTTGGPVATAGFAVFSGSGVLVTAAAPTGTGSVAFASTGVLSAGGRSDVRVGASLSGQGSLTAVGVAVLVSSFRDLHLTVGEPRSRWAAGLDVRLPAAGAPTAGTRGRLVAPVRTSSLIRRWLAEPPRS